MARVAALVSIAVAALWIGPAEIGRFAIVTLILCVPRLAEVPRPFDAAFGTTLLLAAWSGAAGWYEALSWWDLAVHAITTGAVAAMVYLVLARLGIVANLQERRVRRHRVTIVVLTAALGLSVAAVWEFVEWAGNRYLTDAIHVGYLDTVADLAMGGAGSVLAGLLLVAWSRAGWGTHRRDSEHPAGRDTGGR